MPSFESFVARRYVRRAEGQGGGRRFLRFITYVAIAGVAVGVAALLLAVSIVRGFSDEIERKIIGFGAHVQVENYRDAPLGGADTLATRLSAFDGVVDVQPVVQEFALLRRDARQIDGVALTGVERMPSFIRDNIIEGDTSAAPALAGLVVGATLARSLQLSPGTRVAAFSMRGLAGDGSTGRPRVKQYTITAVYKTSLSNYDDVVVFGDIRTARDLFAYGDTQVSRFDILVASPEQSSAVADAIVSEFGFPIIARTVFELFRNLFAWVDLQEAIIPVVIGVIIVVAAFNIIGILLMMALEKSREIGILAALGAAPRRIRLLFLRVGWLVGVFGTIIGETLALALALLQKKFGLIPLPAEAYYMDTAPIELNLTDFVIVAVVAMALCLLAAYIPARVASRLDPVSVIRFR